jgi:serine protease
MFGRRWHRNCSLPFEHVQVVKGAFMRHRFADLPAPDSASFRALALAGALILSALVADAAHAATVATLRVRLHPDAAESGTLPPLQQERLEAMVGTSLTLTGTTRTGALLLSLGTPADDAALMPALRALRNDRAVLWADTLPATSATRSERSLQASPLANQTGSRLMVRLADSTAPDWNILLPQLGARVGASLSLVRSIGDVWVLELAAPVRGDELATLAAQLQDDPAVRFADPVLRRYAKAMPGDPLVPNQWALWDPIGGVNAPAAWDVETGSAAIVVGVVDTGTLPHSELAGRVLPGYDFISNPAYSRDGDGRDPDPRDEGTWNDEGECFGAPAEPSVWHGIHVSGIIAANANNGVGIAGMDWAARILPVRALGKCGGTDEDVFEGMFWAAGGGISGVPLNFNPARVINLSLGGPGACPQAVQGAIDDALATGAVVVVAAGNESDDAENFAPANCSGVITVGAANRSGDRSFYSNFGRRVDISAPGGDIAPDFTVDPGLAILSLWNTGTTTPADDTYAYAMGTSMATPYVTGTVSLMLGRNPTLTPGRVLSILQGSARDFPAGSACAIGNLCGAGLLDAGLALASTPSAGSGPEGTIAVVEYYDAARDHYFITGDAVEIASVDNDPSRKYARTGLVFYAYPGSFASPYASAPVCRFHADDPMIDSHFLSADAAQCAYMSAHAAPTWTQQSSAAFYAPIADGTGNCPAGTAPVYRFDNNRQDFNQRHTIDPSVKRAMLNRAWVPDGAGTRGVAFCSPI